VDTVEQELTWAAFRKLLKGETMSLGDFNRIVNVFKTVPINIDSADQAQVLGVVGQFKAVLQERFLGNK
jgi:hypothetical protein